MSPNPIVNMLQPAGGANPLAGIFNALRGTQNPIALLQSMAPNDPNIQTVVNILNQNGGNAQQAFYTTAQSMGADPTAYINQARSMMQ